MGIEEIFNSLNNEIEKAITLKEDSDILKQWEIYHRILQGVEILERVIENDNDKQAKQVILDHVKEIAHTIRPTNRLDYYK